MLKGNAIYLRTLETFDLEFLYELENNPSNWLVSNTLIPFSNEILLQYIQSAQDIFLTKQIRFVICEQATNRPIGAIDMFDYDPLHQRAGIGIVILEEYRGRGVAKEALELIKIYASNTLLLHGLHCSILMENTKSIQLFTSCGFEQIGIRKDWIRTSNGWLDEGFFQLVF